MALDGNERRDLYRKMLNDPATQGETRKYSFVDWEKKLLGDEKAIGKLAQFAVNKNWAIDESDFAERYIPEAIQAPPAPKPQPIPAAPAPVEEEPYIPEPPPAVGSPAYDVQLQAQYGGMAPTLGATFAGTPAAFETKEQKKQEQISPAFKAQQLAFEDVPIAEEQRRSQRQFAKATKQQQQAALQGGPGYELEQEKKAKKRELSGTASDLIGSWSEGGKRIAKNILSYGGYLAQTQAATDPMANLPYEKRQEMMQEAGQTLYDNAADAQNTFQDEIAKRNIQTSVLQAIDKGQYSRIPEAVLYTVGDAAMQIIPSILTFGGSTYFQTIPQVYKEGVDAIAKEKGISPEQVVASGEDAFIVSQINGGIQTALEYAGAGLVSKGIASKGGYKAMRDWLLSQNVNRKLAQGAALLGVGIGEGTTEYFQEMTGQAGKTAAKSPTARAFFEKIPNEIFTPEARRQREEAFVGGLVGGLGLAGGGQAIQSAMDRTLFETPKIGKATQRPDMDVVQTDNKIQERNKIAQAMEEAVQGNPEAEGQIRAQYQKRINEAAPADDEVLMAYESLALLPETEEKNTIRENLEAYMAEKGLQPEPTGIDAGLGELMRRGTPVIETVNPDFPPPIAPTEEAPAEEVTAPTGMFEGLQGPTEEQAVPQTGMFEGIEGPQAEEEENFIVEPDSELSQKILDNGEQVVSRLDAEKRIGDGERLFGFNEQDDSLVELSLQNLGAFPIDTIIAVKPEVIEAAPVAQAEEIVAAAPAPKGGKKKAAPVTPAPAAPEVIPVEPASLDTEQQKQKSLEDEVERIKAQIKSLRSENGSVLPEKRAEFDNLANLLTEAVKNTKRGNTTDATPIRVMPEDNANEAPRYISDANEKAEAADLIEQAIQSSKTWEEAMRKIRKLGYTFNANDNIKLASYLQDRFNPDAPRIGNNKDSFQAWVNGKTDAELTALAEEAPAAPKKEEGKKAEAKGEKVRIPEEPTKKGVRFEKGKKLTEEEKKEVYKNLKDSYKEMKRPYTIETRVSQYTGRDYEARVWLESASDYMQTSDVTGRKLRYYIFLPDGTLAHPTEIFPNISSSEMTRVQRNVEYNERQANEKMDDITSQLKKSGEIDKVVKAIETALKNGAEFIKEYDSGDVGQKNPLVMLRFPNGRKWGVPQYVINTQDSILGFTQQDVVKDNLGESREKIFDTNYQPDWEQFYNNNKQAEPTAKKIDKKSVQASLDKAKEEYEKAKGAFDKKRSELDKTTREDVKDLFGERKVEMKAKGLFEMPRISPEQRERAIQPFRDRMNKAKEEVNRLTKMLEEGEEAVKELTFEKEKEYEQVQGTGKEARKGKGAPKTERAVRPKGKPVRNAGKTPDAIAARNITFYSDPFATSLQYLMDATYHPDLLESIFGGPSRTTKSGRKDISGERKVRIQFLDKTSNIKSADRLGEYLAERYAEENNIDVKDAEQQHDFASIATDIISSYSSRSQMVRELLRLNEQQSDEFEFMYNPEGIYGEGYNEDIAKEIDSIMDELPDSYWEGREITDEEFGNLFAEEEAPETKEGKKAEARGEKVTTRLKDYKIKPPSDDVSEVAQSSGLTAGKKNTTKPISELSGGVDLKQEKERRRVDKLKKEITSEGGYISRLIVNKDGEVIEGQHRLEALRELGFTEVPVVELLGPDDYISDVIGLRKAIEDAGLKSVTSQNELVDNITEILVDEKGDVSQLEFYEAPKGYEKPWFAAVKFLTQQQQPSAPSFTSQQSSEAATAFDKAKTSKGFDKKHGKGAYKALSDITKNFDDIMDNLSDKIKQDCL